MYITKNRIIRVTTNKNEVFTGKIYTTELWIDNKTKELDVVIFLSDTYIKDEDEYGCISLLGKSITSIEILE